MYRLLFVSSGQPDPGMMAAALARARVGEDWRVDYASDTPRAMHPAAAALLEAERLPVPVEPVKHPSDYRSVAFDVVVTFCESSARLCPTFTGLPARFHWPLDDLVDCREGMTEACLYDLFTELRGRIDALLELDTLTVVTQLRGAFGALIDHLTDGVLAHDSKRRIFVFNRAAEEITGLAAAEVIGRDCHEVFPGLFCGGECSFCSGGVTEGNKLRYPSKFIGPDGEILDLEMSAITFKTPLHGDRGSMIIFRDLTEVNRLKRSLRRVKGFQGMVGRHPSMRKVFHTVAELADETVPVLIQGESGTGKELVAEALHRLSARRDKPFVPVNCGALPEGILESELFGHVAGAFTGAIRDKKGRFELAEGGTLFLDEIGEISPALQVKLLRVLEEKAFVPVGGERQVRTNVRIVCATNRDLWELTRAGKFREDLYYRLAVVPLTVPPLRERAGDIPLLVDHVIEEVLEESGRTCTGVSPEAMRMLTSHPWPGNVRQLANAVQYALIKCHGGRIEPEHLPPEIASEPAGKRPSRAGRPAKLDPAAVERALAAAGGNRAKAARALGVARSTLYRYLEQLQLSDNTHL